MQKWIVLALPLASLSVKAQTKEAQYKQKIIDSIILARVSEIAKAYPMLRQISVSNDLVLKRRSSTDFNKEKVFSSKLLTNRTRANINLPVFAKNRNVFNVSLNYSYQFQQYGNVEPVNTQGTAAEGDKELSTNTYGFGLSYVRNDSLFHLPVVYSLTVAGVTATSGAIQKMSYMANVMFNLKRTPVTSLSLGAIIIIDPSLTMPFIPVLSYYRRLQSSQLELLIDMPQRAILRKQFNKKSWITLGTEVANSVSFLDLGRYSLPTTTNYSTFELKNGLNFEYEIAPKVVAGIGGGIFTTVSSRMFKATGRSNEYFIRDRTKPAPYLNISISFLPFMRSLIR